MFRILLCLLLILPSFLSYAQNQWLVNIDSDQLKHFRAAYQKYPGIPAGLLEAISYNNSRLKHLVPDNNMPSCLGIPSAYGLMGLIKDGKGYFDENLKTISRLSGFDESSICNDPAINVLAFAKAYHFMMLQENINSQDLALHLPLIEFFSEIPKDATLRNQYALDAHSYAVFKNLKSEVFKAVLQLPERNIDLEKIYGEAKLKILSANQVRIEGDAISNEYGDRYHVGSRSFAPPCTDLSIGFPYTVIQDAADPSNYSSRNGTSISHITIHTMQGSYAGAISWFKNPVANVSAHYNIRSSDGQITQMVCEIDKAWHVGNSNPYAVGIEHEGYVNDPSWYTDIMYEVSAALSKDISIRNGIPFIRTYDINGDNGLNPISDGCFKIKGHQHFPSQSHTDPGPNWDWNRYYDLINPMADATINTFSAASGSFYDSGGPTGNYSNDERIFYLIAPPSASTVQLDFNALNLELNYDYLYIYDGDSHYDPLISVLNGNSIPASITANSGKMLLEFRTDCGTVASGWDAQWTSSTLLPSCSKTDNLYTSNADQNSVNLHWDAVAAAQSYEIKVRQSIAAATEETYYSSSNSFNLSGLASNAQYLWSVRVICGAGDSSAIEGAVYVHAESTTSSTTDACEGSFTDSGGAYGLYRKNEDYTFTIAPVNATEVSLNFSSFDLELNYDYMYIYDGASTSAPLIGTFTGTNSPGLIQSSGAALTIRFTSDVATQNPGWIANWNCQSNGDYIHPNVILLDSSLTGELNCGLSYHDFFDSGADTASYGNNESYIKTFCNPDTTKAIRLSFRPNPSAALQLNISSTTTGNDYLYFYNGPDTSSNLIGVYTGASSAAPQPGTFISTRHCMTVQMESDANFIGDGFKARLYCSDPPQDLGTVYVGGTEGTKTFTDLGGTASNYGNNESYIIHYCPDASAAAGTVVWAEFLDTVGIENSWDYLYVFDGADTENSRLICAYTGNSSNKNTLETIKATIENTSGCLTFQFFSDGATTADGWHANVYTAAPRLEYGAEDCSEATLIAQANADYAGSNAISTGTPNSNDPSLNISIASLSECSGTNTITRLENTVWYRFITPDSNCQISTIDLEINNISCQGEGNGGSGVQFVLYEVDQCYQGINWPAPIYCADKLTNGSSVNIGSLLKANQSYYIMIDGFTGQHCNFDLRLNVNTVVDPNCNLLALELLNFDGLKADQANLLKWTTQDEDQVLGFELESAEDAINFEKIAYLSSNSENGAAAVYHHYDHHIQSNALLYYRLKILNANGSHHYSNTISIDRRNEGSDAEISVFPNPAVNTLNFSSFFEKEAVLSIQIYDVQGRLIYQQSEEHITGKWNESLNISSLANGLYLYQIKGKDFVKHGKFEKI